VRVRARARVCPINDKLFIHTEHILPEGKHFL